MLNWILFFLTPAVALAQSALLIEHARLIDGTGAPPAEDIAILIEEGRIARVGRTGSIKHTASREVIDATGKTVIPGIINLRSHVGLTAGLTQSRDNSTRENILSQLGVYASFGVTTTTALAAAPTVSLRIRDEIDSGAVRSAARLETALSGFTSVGGYPTRQPGFASLVHEARSSRDARRHVDHLKSAGASFVHIWMDHRDQSVPALSPKIYRAIIRRARKHGLRVSAQAPRLDDAKGLVRAGVNILVQSFVDREVDAEFIELVLENGVTYAPALVAEEVTFEYGDRAPWLYDNFFKRSIGGGITGALNGEELLRQALDPDRSRRIHGLRQARRNLKILFDAGVPIGIATGSGLSGRFEGFFEHREVGMLVEAGLDPLEVVKAFSSNSANALGIEADRGSLLPGRRADMVILNANPADDIGNLRELHAVLVGGRLAKL